MPYEATIKDVMSFALRLELPDGRTGYVHMTEVAHWPEDAWERQRRFPVGSSMSVEITDHRGMELGLRPAGEGAAKPPIPGGPAAELGPFETPSPDPSDPDPFEVFDGGELPADDPDPFSSTARDPAERKAMLEKLSDYLRPHIAAADDARRSQLRKKWNELRRQQTVEDFRREAEHLLAAIEGDESAEAPSSAPKKDRIGGVAEPDGRVDYGRSVLDEVPPAPWSERA